MQNRAQARTVEQKRVCTKMQQERAAATLRTEAEATKAMVEKIIADREAVRDCEQAGQKRESALLTASLNMYERGNVSL
ncbi:hypothetical protein [Burkholderia gladioli]|uniref:hypothetical protein n=1 Tax=Burkholderia gladioli TaxID=28095 RepID=UPI00163FEDDC|nr:hypothetical protein [Burkholderia gladioli]